MHSKTLCDIIRFVCGYFLEGDGLKFPACKEAKHGTSKKCHIKSNGRRVGAISESLGSTNTYIIK